MTVNSKLFFMTTLLFVLTVFSPIWISGIGGDAKAWTDGNRDSPVRPNYGIQDMIAHKALMLLNESSPEKAEFMMFWFKVDGSDDNENSFDSDHLFPREDDNFLAWTDDGPEGVTVDYFINNPEPGQDPQTDAVQFAQLLANRSLANLTEWLFEGGSSNTDEEIRLMHSAAYNAGKLAKYVGDMSQYGHTDYSKWDQLSVVPQYHPSEVNYPYREYYEARVWSDTNMETLYQDFWNNRTFTVPTGFSPDTVHTHTSDFAKWVNSRDQPPVQIEDYDGTMITVGHNYDIMLRNFMYCWDYDLRYNGVRGFNSTLWELTLENIVRSAETLAGIYGSLYDEAWSRFLDSAPELSLVDWGIHPDPAVDGDMVMVNATIRNDGDRPTDQFKLLIQAETPEGPFSNWRGLTLGPGEEKNVSFLEFSVGADPVQFNITIDYEFNVAESDETNNHIEGSVTPIPEYHSATLSLAEPFSEIRRDTEKRVSLRLTNTGNRADTFFLSGTSNTPGLEVFTPSRGVLVRPNTNRVVPITLSTSIDASLVDASVDLVAQGENSTASFTLPVTILERTRDPVPVITGYEWGRLDENITLSALDSYDPDGDPLTYLWVIPLSSNSTEPEITVNYSKPGTYDIELHVFDGNATVSITLPLVYYPNVPDNVSAELRNTGVSGLTVTWLPWNAGGLINYWIEASALPGQGDRSLRGPYTRNFTSGNTSGRIGKFLPGTEVEIKVTVQAERYGNVTTDILSTTTADLSSFEDTLRLNVDDSFLNLEYKPWVDPEGERIPVIEVEREYQGDLIPIDVNGTYIQKTNSKDTLRYTLGSNSGRYRASLTYYWKDEGISPFDLFIETEKPNKVPDLSMNGTEQEFMLNVNGTCRVWFQIKIDDPQDTAKIYYEWGDGSSENTVLSVPSNAFLFHSIFHNYTEVGEYEFSLRVEDWSGDVVWYNKTIEVLEYRETKKGEEEERSIWTLVLIIIFGIVIVAAVVVLGMVAYKMAKKDTEVEFKMKDFKSEIEKKQAGTGTDFDQRRGLQIPRESIMMSSKPEEPKEIIGKVTFEDDEE